VREREGERERGREEKKKVESGGASIARLARVAWRPAPGLERGLAAPRPATPGAHHLPSRHTLTRVYAFTPSPTAIPMTRLRPSRAAGGSGGSGGGVAERPALKPSLTPSKVGDRARSSPYRVLLHNDDVNRREAVVSVLMKVVDGLTVDDAVNVMNEAHTHGTACVIVCGQPDAERYCEGLRGNGLISSIEPASGGGKGGGGGEPA
jgi:ATP-dependent Clp protease adaptor protein ClpS